ncbi:uncharacterized protein LOC133344965 [Lethenteron reissneri]|uniref:uncharacterized protein LOC133344965 n=1 Tax=Lethenteron reissneri TaxID=7753 RepID=UPI002AB6A96F|nr:uncharacterized protein LOC133344965 [Lethenteron reissneri]
MLDGDALAMFRSIPADKKTLPQAFQEMAEVYEPPDDRTKKFQHRWWGSSELPLAYRSALMALAVDAYPNVTQELLDPLVMERMLALAWEMDVVLPTCGHEMKTPLWVARCLNAHINLKRWAQMVAWMGDPAKDGQPIGWSPSKVVDVARISIGRDRTTICSTSGLPLRATDVAVWAITHGSATLVLRRRPVRRLHLLQPTVRRHVPPYSAPD